MTRSNRLVKITGSEIVNGPKAGGGIAKKTLAIGTLFKMDGKTVDGLHRWETNGAFANQNGVASQFDLCQIIRKEDGAAPDAPQTEAAIEEAAAEAALGNPVMPRELHPSLVDGVAEELAAAAFTAVIARAKELKLIPKKLKAEVPELDVLRSAVVDVVTPFLPEE